MFEIDAPVAIKTVVEPKACPSQRGRPSTRCTWTTPCAPRGAATALFALTRDADPVPKFTSTQRRTYGASKDVVSGAGLGKLVPHDAA